VDGTFSARMNAPSETDCPEGVMASITPTPVRVKDVETDMGLSDTPSFVQLCDAYWLDSPHLGEHALDPAPPAPPPRFAWRTAMVGLSALTVAVALVVALV
jgi:hypothetical protein